LVVDHVHGGILAPPVAPACVVPRAGDVLPLALARRNARDRSRLRIGARALIIRAPLPKAPTTAPA
jgi:hypothetical protein